MIVFALLLSATAALVGGLTLILKLLGTARLPWSKVGWIVVICGLIAGAGIFIAADASASV